MKNNRNNPIYNIITKETSDNIFNDLHSETFSDDDSKDMNTDEGFIYHLTSQETV